MGWNGSLNAMRTLNRGFKEERISRIFIEHRTYDCRIKDKGTNI